MDNKYRTEQELFWATDFGDEYIERNSNNQIIAGNLALFSKIINETREVNSIIEFGSNVGMNLKALKLLLPHIKDFSAIEINPKAVEILKSNMRLTNIYADSIFNFTPDYQRDFVLIKGVLIHINPDMLNVVYDLLYKTSKKYICIAEYYSPTPIALQYRGYENKLFKRDFAGEMLDKYDDLKLLDYGFCYHRSKNYFEEDINWFLLEKLNK